MRRSPVAGATGSRAHGSRQVEPPARKRRQSPSDVRRKEARVDARKVETVERIQETAHERHEAWVDGDHANVVEHTTTKLEGLYDTHRWETAGTLRDPYYGKTMQAGTGK